MKSPPSPDSVIVSDESFRSENPSDLVASNVSLVNAFLREHLTLDEISRDAVRSYFADYYLAQVTNGGFSQFVYNSRWDPTTVRLVRKGLRAIGAKRHLALFEEGATLVEQLGGKRFEEYLDSEYFGENDCRDELNALDDRFSEISAGEDIQYLNAAWLRQLTNLRVLTIDQIREEVRRRGSALPDRDERIAAARASEPRYMKLIRALCERAGHELSHVTAGDPTRVHDGVETLAWYFITDKGLYHMIEAHGKAFMFRGSSTTDRICEITVTTE